MVLTKSVVSCLGAQLKMWSVVILYFSSYIPSRKILDEHIDVESIQIQFSERERLQPTIPCFRHLSPVPSGQFLECIHRSCSAI